MCQPPDPLLLPTLTPDDGPGDAPTARLASFSYDRGLEERQRQIISEKRRWLPAPGEQAERDIVASLSALSTEGSAVEVAGGVEPAHWAGRCTPLLARHAGV